MGEKRKPLMEGLSRPGISPWYRYAGFTAAKRSVVSASLLPYQLYLLFIGLDKAVSFSRQKIGI